MGAIYFSDDLRVALTAFEDRPRWLIEPYLPAEGIVLFHGKYSIGKSPMIWKIAQCVSEGSDFFGIAPSETGGVVYIELDEPLRLTVERLRLLDPLPTRVTAVGMNPFSILRPSQEDLQRFAELAAATPKLVIVNTLRKCHHLDDKESAAPSLVYGAWKRIFPSSTFLFVHHDKKSVIFEGKPIPAGDEDFSGSQAWINDAQIGLHLRGVGERSDRRVKLVMTKSQLSALQDPLELRLADDGVNWEDTRAASLRVIFDRTDSSWPKMRRYEETAKAAGVSVSTVQRALATFRETQSHFGQIAFRRDQNLEMSKDF